ncbi:MAG: TRAP transporter small permease [Gammaproteobacteria bacterium]|nr:TRAP transporter small permease [Gammaproteobacteria bacterium]
MLSKLDRYFEDVLCVICLAVVACSVMIQVILRFVFASASAWAEETAVFGMIFAVYLGCSLAVRERAHVRITMLVRAVPRQLLIVLIILADLLWFFFVWFMVQQTIVFTQLLFEVTYITPGLGIEQKWIQMFIPAIFVLIAFRMLQVYWRWWKEGWKGLPL